MSASATSTIILVNAALTVVEQLLPRIAQLKANGEVSAEQQAELLAKYESLKTQADGQFSGPEWQITP